MLADLGMALLHAGRAGEALAPLRRSVALAPASPDARATLAFAEWSAGDPAAAEAEALRALALRPDHGSALHALGGARLDRGDAAGALDGLARRSGTSGTGWAVPAESPVAPRNRALDDLGAVDELAVSQTPLEGGPEGGELAVPPD